MLSCGMEYEILEKLRRNSRRTRCEVPLDRHAAKAFPLPAVVEALAVSTSGYRAWKRGGRSNRKRLTDAQLLPVIQTIHQELKGAYGSPRMLHEIRERGFPAGKERVERLMRENGIRRGTSAATRPRRTRGMRCRLHPMCLSATQRTEPSVCGRSQKASYTPGRFTAPPPRWTSTYDTGQFATEIRRCSRSPASGPRRTKVPERVPAGLRGTPSPFRPHRLRSVRA